MYAVAVDVGGTFTDVVVLDEERGEVLVHKVLSTPREPERAFLEGVAEALRRLGAKPGEVSVVVHATTIGTNLLLGQVGLEPPRVALFTTKGFRDVIEIARQNRPRLYDPFFEKPRPLVPRELRFEVDERVDARGRVLKGLDPAELELLAREARRRGAVSAAVVFLHSYANPANELRAKEVLSKHFEYVSASFEVAPEPREYERASTTVVNAVEMPVVSRYLSAVAERLSAYGNPRFYVMASSGGLVDAEEASRRPVQLIESGPAAGVVASAELAKLLGYRRVISFDVGGTTAKAGIVVDYEPEVTTEFEVGGEVHHGRVVKGSGYPIRYPSIDLAEVSAGGGTIVWRDAAGALRVGPRSAGADPGPICYGRGGTEPTLTDANLALGRIGDSLLGGSMRLDREGAVRGLSRLGDPVEVAEEALRLACLEMARAIRLVTVERGFDPRDFVLFAFGGAGPQFAAEVAEELGVERVVVPIEPGHFSALGLLMADLKIEARRAALRPLDDGLEGEFRELEERLAERLPGASFVRYVDAMYEGQGWELTVPAPRPFSAERVRAAFEEKHLRAFGFTLDRPIVVTTVRVFAVAPRRRFKPKPLSAPGGAAPVGLREVVFDERVAAPVYDRRSLGPGFEAEGPLIVEEYASTTVVPPGWRVSVDRYGNLVLERG